MPNSLSQPPAGVPAIGPVYPWGEDQESPARHDHLAMQLHAVLDQGLRAELPEKGKLWAHAENDFKAGAISKAAAFWRDTLLPEAPIQPALKARVMEWVAEGVDVRKFIQPFAGPFKGEHIEAAYPPKAPDRNPRLTTEHLVFADAEITKLIDVGAVSKVESIPWLVMPIFVADNSAGKLRLVYDARRLNCFCPSEPLSYETLLQFQRGLAPGDLMFSLDHKSGYHHVPIHPRARTLLGMQWKGQYYVWNVLPFGWAPACFVYNTMSSVVAAFLRRRGLHTIVYLDDFGFALRAAATQPERDRSVWMVMAVMYLAGYTVSLAKSKLTPSQLLILLGFGLDTVRQQYFVPEQKLTKIIGLLTEVLRRTGKYVPLTMLQSIVGKLHALSRAAPCVGTFLVAAHKAMSEADKSGASRARLSPEVREDLNDLLALGGWSGLSRWRREQHATIRLETDASGTGWGAVLFTREGEPITLQGTFGAEDLPAHIYAKEALAVVYAVTNPRAAPHLRDCVLDLYTDNEIVRFTLLKGSVDYPLMRKLARQLLNWQLENNVHVRIRRVTTEENVTADALSRTGNSLPLLGNTSEFRLTDAKFEMLRSWYTAEFTIDVCATAENRRLPRYITNPRKTDPGAVASNVFLWGAATPDEFVYCYPPWSLIPATWRHMSLCKAKGVMVVPDDPSLPWYGAVTNQARSVGRLALVGDATAILVLEEGRWVSKGPLPHGLLAVEFDFTTAPPVDFRP